MSKIVILAFMEGRSRYIMMESPINKGFLAYIGINRES